MLSRALYRSLLRKASQLSRADCQLLLRPPMDPGQWGQGRFVQHDHLDDVLESCFDFAVPGPALDVLAPPLPPPAAAAAAAAAGVTSPADGGDGGGGSGSGSHDASESRAAASDTGPGGETSAASGDSTDSDGGDGGGGAFAGVPARPASDAWVPRRLNPGLVPPRVLALAMRAAARHYQAECARGTVSQSKVVDLAFSALRSLTALVNESLATTVATTAGVQVSQCRCVHCL